MLVWCSEFHVARSLQSTVTSYKFIKEDIQLLTSVSAGARDWP